MFGRVRQRIARLRIDRSRRRIARDRTQHLAVEIGVVGGDRPVARDLADGAERDAVDPRLAVELFRRDEGIAAVDLILVAFVAECRCRQQQAPAHRFGLDADFIEFGAFRCDIAGRRIARSVDRRLGRGARIGIGGIDADRLHRLVDQADAIGEQIVGIVEAGAGGQFADIGAGRCDRVTAIPALVAFITDAAIQFEMVAERHRVEQIDGIVFQLAMVAPVGDIVDRTGIDVAAIGKARRTRHHRIGIGDVDQRIGRRRPVRIALHIAAVEEIFLPAGRYAEHDRMFDPAGIGDRAEIGLVIHQLVARIAQRAARAARLIEARRGTGDAVRRHAAGQAENALGRVDDGKLAHILPAGQVAHAQPIAERMVEDRRCLIDVDLLGIHVAEAEIAAAIDARDRPGIAAADIEGNAIGRQVHILLMQIGQCQAGRPVRADLDRRCDAPAFIFLPVAARHVVAVDHGVQPDGDQVADAMIGVERAAIIAIGADAAGDGGGVLGLGPLGHDVDRSADRTRPAIDRIGAVHDLQLFEVERIGAAILRAVAHAVLGDVGIRRKAAQHDRIAIAATAFARAKGDAGHGRQHIAQGEQILFLDRLVGDDRHRLRRIAHRTGRFGAFLFGLHVLPRDHYPVAFLRRRIGRIDRIGGPRIAGGRDKADRGKGEEGGRRLAAGIGCRCHVGPLLITGPPLLRVVRNVNAVANHLHLF